MDAQSINFSYFDADDSDSEPGVFEQADPLPSFESVLNKLEVQLDTKQVPVNSVLLVDPSIPYEQAVSRLGGSIESVLGTNPLVLSVRCEDTDSMPCTIRVCKQTNITQFPDVNEFRSIINKQARIYNTLNIEEWRQCLQNDAKIKDVCDSLKPNESVELWLKSFVK